MPKLGLPVGEITEAGLVGDRQRDLVDHGGPNRALCLFARERLDDLQREGHPVVPGGMGENVLIEGLDWATVLPGRRLVLGNAVEIEVTGYAAPCKTIAHNFADRRFVRVSDKVNPGWSRVYARVLEGGTVRVGDPVVLCPAREPRVESAPR